MDKRKKVAGVELLSSSFAYVGDKNDPSTWHLPVFVPHDAKKTSNLIASALHRVDVIKGIPNDQRAEVRLLLHGAALAHGLEVDRPQLAAKSNASTPAAEPTPPVPLVMNEQIEEIDPAVSEAIARADHLADRLLRSLGLE